MIQENELVPLIIGVGVLVFFFAARARLREFPAWTVFAAAFYVYLTGWVFTVLEGLWVGFDAEVFLAAFFNMLEHICYAVSSILFALWSWKVFRRSREAQP
jgi:hypothetical protein